MTDKEFWDIIEPYGWGTKTTDYKAIKIDLMRRLSPDQAVSLKDKFLSLREALDQRMGIFIEGLGDDSYSDLLAHIIGMGREEYAAVMANPLKGKQRSDNLEYTESFLYSLPYETDYLYNN